MRCLDEQYLATPFYGSRRMVAMLRRDGEVVNRKRVRRLMRMLGIEAIYQKPNSSWRHPEQQVYPYLLRDLVVDRLNHVWCADNTYIPLAKGFVYPVAVMDWFSDVRLHQTLGYRTPREIFEAAPTCGYVDNASALTTSPQAPPGFRLMTKISATSGWDKHSTRTPSPTIPAAPVMIGLIAMRFPALRQQITHL